METFMNPTRRDLIKYTLASSALPALMACAGDSSATTTTGGNYPVKLEKDVRIPLRDGSYVVADIFRPDDAGQFPVIMSMGPYPKDIPFKDWSPADYARQEIQGEFMHWETPLPESWVPNGYVQIRCDQRGSGASPGKLEILGRQLQTDFYDAIEWAGIQPWSNGNVGTVGDSYFAAAQWLVAALNPPHLKAILVAQGFSDIYRDAVRHGGLLSARFLDFWYARRIQDYQYGAALNRSSPKLSAAELAANTVFPKDFRLLLRDDLPVTDPFWAERIPDLSKIKAAVFAYANNGGLGLHLNGTIDGFNRSVNAAYRQLYTGIGQDPDFMYRASDVARQKRFFDRFLKGAASEVPEPTVEVTVRTAGGAVKRTGNSYPLASTVPRTVYLDAVDRALIGAVPATASSASYTADYSATSAPVRFETAALPEDLEIVGPALLRLYVSSSVTDADLFVAVREIRPDGTEVTVQGAQDPALPVSMGWLRVSRRNTDTSRATPYRTWHTFDRKEPMVPGTLYAVDVNIWPIAWRFAKGNRLAVEIGGSEPKGMVTFAHPATGPFVSGGVSMPNGVAPAGIVSVHTGPGTESYIRLAVNISG
jgi:uncharacterized protein